MEGILLLAHGSRAPETPETMERIAELVRLRLPDRPVQVAYMQFSEVNIEKGLLLLMEKGVTSVKVAPYFLFEGVHIREDIPHELGEFRKKHPQMNVTLGHTLGIDERLADIIAERIEE